MKNKHDNRSLPANRNYKDTIFRWLFSDKNNLLSLYNAIAGAHYQNPEALNIVTLENAVYMGMKNDLAFVLETGLYLYEHQSTYNPNIPLRDLFYIASEYQSLINQRTLYSSTLQTIPTPKFLVFYNGTDENIPDRLELRLSDAYENYSENPDLELKKKNGKGEETTDSKAFYRHGRQFIGVYALTLQAAPQTPGGAKITLFP